MITLYELHWSHYCEKVRWALDYKKLNWKKINISAFSKKEMQLFPKKQRHLVPFIYDENTQTALGESSDILRYLDHTYQTSPALFIKNKRQNKIINQWLLDLDSKLGVIGRRLGYAQIILEKPTILSQLFLKDIFHGIFTWPIIKNISSSILAMLLIKRFRFDLNEELSLYESLECYLLSINEIIKKQNYLVNNIFTAADITLATYMRPLSIIPFFKENPQLFNLFAWQENILAMHQREPQLLYQILIEENRKKHPPVRRKMKLTLSNSDFFNKIDKTLERSEEVYNDQEPIWTWRILLTPYYYFFKMRRNKVRKASL